MKAGLYSGSDLGFSQVGLSKMFLKPCQSAAEIFVKSSPVSRCYFMKVDRSLHFAGEIHFPGPCTPDTSTQFFSDVFIFLWPCDVLSQVSFCSKSPQDWSPLYPSGAVLKHCLHLRPYPPFPTSKGNWGCIVLFELSQWLKPAESCGLVTPPPCALA